MRVLSMCGRRPRRASSLEVLSGRVGKPRLAFNIANEARNRPFRTSRRVLAQALELTNPTRVSIMRPIKRP